MSQIRANIDVVKCDSSQAVALWFRPTAGDTVLVSDIGAVEGTVLPHYRDSHCTDQRRCLTIEKPLGRRVLISRALLAELVGSGHATAHDGSDLVSVRVDHVRDRDGDAAEWMFRLVPVRWSRTDARDEADSELLLAVWPD